jgi:hypothetical protein
VIAHHVDAVLPPGSWVLAPGDFQSSVALFSVCRWVPLFDLSQIAAAGEARHRPLFSGRVIALVLSRKFSEDWPRAPTLADEAARRFGCRRIEVPGYVIYVL